MPSAFPGLSAAGGTITGPLTVTGLLTTQAGQANSGASIANTGAGVNFTTTTGGGMTGGFLNASLGNIDVQSAGSGLRVAEGANAKQGTGTLVGGTLTVANTSVTANSRIFITSQVDGGTPGFLRVSARTAGTSFTVTSSSGTDTSTFAYEIYEPG